MGSELRSEAGGGSFGPDSGDRKPPPIDKVFSLRDTSTPPSPRLIQPTPAQPSPTDATADVEPPELPPDDDPSPAEFAEQLRGYEKRIEKLGDVLQVLVEAEKRLAAGAEDVDVEQVKISGSRLIEEAQHQCPQSQDQLQEILQRLKQLEARTTPPSGLRTLVEALIRIGVATLAGAAVGAPIGAILVKESIKEEAIKVAVGTSITQAAMEILQVGMDRRATAHEPCDARHRDCVGVRGDYLDDGDISGNYGENTADPPKNVELPPSGSPGRRSRSHSNPLSTDVNQRPTTNNL